MGDFNHHLHALDDAASNLEAAINRAIADGFSVSLEAIQPMNTTMGRYVFMTLSMNVRRP